MKKGKYLVINGELFNIQGQILVGGALTYRGYGNILASSIKRTSKNNYIVIVIYSNNVVFKRCCFSMTDSIAYLQRLYLLQCV